MTTEANVISIVSFLNKAHILKATHVSLSSHNNCDPVSAFRLVKTVVRLKKPWVFLSKFKIINTLKKDYKIPTNLRDKKKVLRKFTLHSFYFNASHMCPCWMRVQILKPIAITSVWSSWSVWKYHNLLNIHKWSMFLNILQFPISNCELTATICMLHIYTLCHIC